MENYDFAGKIHDLSNRGQSFVVATVVSTDGSSLAKPGFKVVVHDNSIIYGTLGGACPEGVILEEASKVLKSGTPKTIKIHLEEAGEAVSAMISRKTDDEIFVETFCGGTLDVFLEPFKPSERLVIIGQGGKDDVEESLVHLGKKLDFKVTVLDHAPALEEEPDELISDLALDLSKFEFTDDDYIVVLTKGERDIEALSAVSTHNPAYVGLMASKKRVAHDFEELKKKGVSEEFLSSVHTPIGIDISAVTPFEIALSISSEIVQTRRGKAKNKAKQVEKIHSPN